MSLLQALLINLASILIPGILLYGLLAHVGRLRNKHLGVPTFAVFLLTMLLFCTIQILALDDFPTLPDGMNTFLTFAAYLGLAFVALRAFDLLVIESVLIDKKGLYLPRILRIVLIAIGLAITALILSRTVLGVNVVALVAVPTVLTAIIGFALKDTLERLVSGIILGKTHPRRRLGHSDGERRQGGANYARTHHVDEAGRRRHHYPK